MRTQYCREHIDAVAEGCGLEQITVDRVKAVADFCEKHEQICQLSTNAIVPLMRERDDNIRDIAILAVSKSLESSKHPSSGRFVKKLTEKDVRLIVDRVRSEIKKEVPIQSQVPQDIDVVTNQTAEPMPVVEPTKAPQAIKEKRATTDKIIEEMLSRMPLRFDGIVERFMTNFPKRFPTKESVIVEALDSLAKDMMQ